MQQQRTKELTPLKERINILESAVSGMEKRIEEINEELVEASTSGDGGLIAALSRELNELNGNLEERYQELFRTTEALEEKERYWERIANNGLRIAD